MSTRTEKLAEAYYRKNGPRITVRLTPYEKNTLRRAAKWTHLSVNEFVRAAVSSAIARKGVSR